MVPALLPDVPGLLRQPAAPAAAAAELMTRAPRSRDAPRARSESGPQGPLRAPLRAHAVLQPGPPKHRAAPPRAVPDPRKTGVWIGRSPFGRLFLFLIYCSRPLDGFLQRGRTQARGPG